MNTKNIYIAKLLVSTNIQFKGRLIDYYTGPGIEHRVYYQKIKYILVKDKNNIFSDPNNIRVVDLNTKKKYSTELPFDKGKLFIDKNLISFDRVYPNEKQNLLKRKILKKGNYAIEEFERMEQEKRKK